MTYAPKTLLDLRDALEGWTGLGPVSLGIVGDARHVRGYHCGKDRIYSSTGLGNADYSVKTARDRDGLTNAASAMDIGNFRQLRAMSTWLVGEARRNAPGTRDLREIIYTPDGRTVYRWDRERGYSSLPQTGEADDTHLTHTHVSWYRDSEQREKVSLFARFFESGEETVRSFNVPEFPGRNATPKEDPARPGNSVWLYSNSQLRADGTEISLKPIRDLQVIAMEIVPGVTALAYEPTGTPDTGTTSRAVFLRREDIARSAMNTLPTANCDDAVAKAVAPVSAALLTANARIATIKGKVAATAADIAND